MEQIIKTIYRTFLNDAIVNKPIKFTGKRVTVLNQYMSLPEFTTLSPRQIDLASYTASWARTENYFNVFPVLAGRTYEFDYDILYLNSLARVSTAGWTWYYQGGSSLILSLEDSHKITQCAAEDYFRHCVYAGIPNGATSTTVDFYHNIQAQVNIDMTINTAANPINVQIIQYEAASDGAVTEINTWPSTFPFYAVYSLPRRASGRTRVYVEGGGSGETGMIWLDFTER